MKVAVLQMEVAFGAPEKNIANFYRLTEQAMTQRPDVLLLPELWRLGFYPQPPAELAGDAADGPEGHDAAARDAEELLWIQLFR